MKKFLIIFSLIIGGCSSTQETTFQIDHVVDGDTIAVTTSQLPSSLQHLLIRVRGVDTPELKGKCLVERVSAQQAKIFTTQMMQQYRSQIHFVNLSWDKYGGRVDADVMVGDKKLSTLLISNKLGRAYGGEKRSGWC